MLPPQVSQIFKGWGRVGANCASLPDYRIFFTEPIKPQPYLQRRVNLNYAARLVTAQVQQVNDRA